jgi:hypothetical protein
MQVISRQILRMTALEKAWYIMYEKAPAAHAAGADLSGSQLW